MKLCQATLVATTIALCAAAHSSPVNAEGSLVNLVTSPKAKSLKVRITPFTNSLNLRQANFKDLVSQVQRASGLALSPQKTSYNLLGAQEKTLYQFITPTGIPLCEYALTKHKLSNGNEYIAGELPPYAELQEDSTAWPELSKALNLVTEALAEAQFNGEAILQDSRKCYSLRADQLIASWDIVFNIGSFSFAALASEEQIFDLEKRFFDVTGKGKIYPHNVQDTELQTFEAENMTSDGKLANDKFYVAIDANSNEELVTATNSIFEFEPGTTGFDQTSIFFNATRTLSWYESMGYQNFGDFRIRLVAHAIIGADKNNALYNPQIGTDSTIFIGEGDGEVLKNLATDADVIAHEFGHHVIFRTLTSTSGESLVLHEGMADFFTFAKTDNACLGESICPANSPIHCAIEQKCLRTAENSFIFGGEDLPEEAHLRSQFISGLLWDLYQNESIPKDEMVKIALGSIDYLQKKSGYQDLIIGLLHADLEIAEGSHCQTIYNQAKARGLGSQIESFDCNNIPAAAKSTAKSGATTPGDSETETTKSSSSGVCGIGSHTGKPLQYAWLYFVPLLPLLGLFIRRMS